MSFVLIFCCCCCFQVSGGSDYLQMDNIGVPEHVDYPRRHRASLSYIPPNRIMSTGRRPSKLRIAPLFHLANLMGKGDDRVRQDSFNHSPRVGCEILLGNNTGTRGNTKCGYQMVESNSVTLIPVRYITCTFDLCMDNCISYISVANDIIEMLNDICTCIDMVAHAHLLYYTYVQWYIRPRKKVCFL